MSERTNADRIESAEVAMIAGQGTCEWMGDPQDMADALTDTIANLRHFANANGLDFDNCARISAYHFEEERGEE